MSLKAEVEALFGEETVRLALIQEPLAQRYIQANPRKVRDALRRIMALPTLDEQREYVTRFDAETTRALICALLSSAASKVVVKLGSQAIADKRQGRAVLGGRLEGGR